MIPVHRLTQPDHELFVNPQLIQTVEANPDTVIALTNGSKFVVSETPAQVARLVREWHERATVADYLNNRRSPWPRKAAVLTRRIGTQ